MDNTEEPEIQQDERQSQGFEALLYEGAPAGLTEYTAHLLLFQYSVKHSLNSQALSDLLHLMNYFLPASSKFPKTVYKLKKFFTTNFSEKLPSMQAFCGTCHRLLKEDEGCACGGRTSQFVTVPIGPQLKARLESK